jgi:hypothetical protein
LTRPLRFQLIREGKKEIEVLRKAEHPNTVQFLGTFKEEACLYIVMELVGEVGVQYSFTRMQ